VSKDRAAPFSRKHRKYWIPVLGGMILIGTLNLAIGFCSYVPPGPEPEKIELVIPRSIYARDGGVPVPDAQVPADAAGDAPPTGAAITPSN
jgi:hypothetical protein